MAAVDDGPHRVEIELRDTGSSPRARGRRGRRDAEVPAAVLAPGPASGWTPPEGAIAVTGPAPPEPSGAHGPLVRIVATALGVGLVALLVGWTLGRAGDDGAAATVDPTSRATTTTQRDSAGDSGTDAGGIDRIPTTELPGDTIAEASVPTTAPATAPVTTRPPTGPTIPPAWTSEQVDVDPRLAGLTDTIVGVDPQRGLVELDLATGELESLDLPAGVLNSTFGVVAGPNWALLVGGDGTSRLVVGRSTDLAESQIGPNFGTIWRADSDLFWRVAQNDPTGTVAEEITVTGTPTGRESSLGGFYPNSVDVDGALIVGDGSFGGFVVDDAGSFRLPGRIVALGQAGWLVRACGDTVDSCGLAMVDRATREVRPLDVDAAGRRIESAMWFVGEGSRPGISPDGRYALVTLIDQQGLTTGAVLDLETAALIEMPGAGYSSALLWSGDGRFVYLLGGAGPSAWEVATGDLITIAEGIGSLQAMTVRPAPITSAG